MLETPLHRGCQQSNYTRICYIEFTGSKPLNHSCILVEQFSANHMKLNTTGYELVAYEVNDYILRLGVKLSE